jgi:hypothetical protein
MRRACNATVALALCAALGCGTILYPERRGQRAGQIDVGVALLDAVGLLFFFVPGVIAFAVDFSTGAIYLPRGQKSRLINTSGPDRSSGLELERIPLAERSLAAVEASLREHRGIDIDLAAHALRIERRVSEVELPALLESLDRQAVSRQLAAR